MQGLPRFRDPNLLIGAENFSDAGVYRVADDLAIIQTVDFFAPLVDDPFVFGQIAAANSLSDVYAMGGQPKTALNIVGFPDKELGLEVLEQILRGGAERAEAAGCLIVGGHSVRDAEVKYGLSVTGFVHPDRMLTNRTARPGDVIILTKGLGTGFIIAANRGGRCPTDVFDAACASMIFLNRAASEAAVAAGASASTDITGFGLAGHGLELTNASEVTVRIELGALPLLPGVQELAVKENFTGALATNRRHAESSVRFEGEAGESPRIEFLFDPQTSGGLLVCLPAERAGDFLDRCRDGGIEQAAVIGEVLDKQDVHLIIRD
ncbi:MAG: selenide, water dikinase SelD [Phycisphaerales bacterium]|nr:MAG: selenide, water dikinase SelD [Phycisphaerales bacterium]